MRACLAVFALSACAGSAGPGPEPSPVSTAREPPAQSLVQPQIAAAESGPESASPEPVASSEFDVSPLDEPEWRSQRMTPRVRTGTLRAPLRKRWSAKVGKTTFRTTMALAGDAIVIGTHGATLQGKNERSDGVYLIDAKSGKQRSLIRTPGTGDLDVGGIALEGDVVYFTSDNSQIVAASVGSGKILWKAAARGKVRPAPALADLNGDGHVDVVAGDEEGMLRALDGKSGQSLWTAATGVNDYNARGFIAAAAIADLDGDRRDDVVAGARDGILTAYRGRDGGVLWQVQNDSGIHASPSVADFDQDGRPEILAAWSYGNVVIIDGATGHKRWLTRLEQDDGGIEGLFGSPVPLPGAPGILIAPTAWWGAEDGVIGIGAHERAFKGFEGRMSASAVVTDLDADGRKEAIIGTEKGTLVAFTAGAERIELASLSGPIEAAGLLADADRNGKFELYVASNDGLLTCFETESSSEPDVPRFRGKSPHNRGDLGQVRLGWRARPPGRAGPQYPKTMPLQQTVRVDYLRCCSALTEAAGRAPAPENAELLGAASSCNSLAASATPRARALEALAQRLKGKAGLPPQCL
jgi:outer membrane protein assembly factor BamB